LWAATITLAQKSTSAAGCRLSDPVIMNEGGIAWDSSQIMKFDWESSCRGQDDGCVQKYTSKAIEGQMGCDFRIIQFKDPKM